MHVVMYSLVGASSKVCTLRFDVAAGDHGVKAQGDGWLTSVTLVEGANIALPDSGAPSPYVVFTCNGRNRTSSVKLRTTNPSWRGEHLKLSSIVLQML